MKADLDIPEVIGVEIVAVPGEKDKTIWDIILINRNDKSLQNVIIASKGYGEVDGRQQKTSVLRHVIEELPAESYARVEPIQKDVFKLTNEYWVSYFFNEQLHDKKFIFTPGSINEQHLKDIPGYHFSGIVQK